VLVTACEKDTVNVTVLPPSRGDSRAHSCKVTDLHLADNDIDHVIYYSTNVTSTQGMSQTILSLWHSRRLYYLWIFKETLAGELLT
jgi:hypothetical protein